MAKKIAYYIPNDLDFIIEGAHARLMGPVLHPVLGLTGHVTTSIVSKNDNGVFETIYTKYIPKQSLKLLPEANGST